MKKRISRILLITMMITAVYIPRGHASGFVDVASTDWYAEYVQMCYENGLMQGTGENTFSPHEQISYEQGIILMARLHQMYYETEEINAEEHWFLPYYDYCISHGLLAEGEYHRGMPMNRESFAYFIGRVLPDECLTEMNEVEEIPGYMTQSKASVYVKKLYRAGILTGMDDNGTFSAYAMISRAECAAILCRIIDSSLRKKVDIKPCEVITQVISIELDGIEVDRFDGTYIYVMGSDNYNAVYNLHGEIIIPWIHAYIYNINDGYFRVDYYDSGIYSKFDFYDESGQKRNPASYTVASDFINGYAVIQDSESREIIIINKSFEVVKNIGDIGYWTYAFYGDYIHLQDGNNVVFYSLKDDKILELSYYDISCKNGYFRVEAFKSNGNIAVNLLDKDLSPLFEQDYADISHWNEDFFVVTEDGINYGVIDRNVNLIIPMEYTIKYGGENIGIFYDANSNTTLKDMTTGETLLVLPQNKLKEYDTEYQVAAYHYQDFIPQDRELDQIPYEHYIAAHNYDNNTCIFMNYIGFEFLELENVALNAWYADYSILYDDGQHLNLVQVP